MKSFCIGNIRSFRIRLAWLLKTYGPLFLFRATVRSLVISGSALALISWRKSELEVIKSDVFRLLVLDFQKVHSRGSLKRLNFGMVLFILSP